MAGQRSSLTSLLEKAAGAETATAAVGASTSSCDENRLLQVRLGMASGLIAALRCKHAVTALHSVRVALTCSAWSSAAGLSAVERDDLEVAALLHDIGKLGIPDHILIKPAPLAPDEAAVMDRYKAMSQEILSHCCASPLLLTLVEYSAAWFDGSRGEFELSGEEIPRGARMVAIADAFDAMTTDHVYRKAFSQERAVHELFQFAGTQFDPELVKEFSEMSATDPRSWHHKGARRWLRDLDPSKANAYWSRQPAVNIVPPENRETIFHERLVDRMRDGVIFVDRNQRIIRWNQGVERLTGLSRESIFQHQWEPTLIGLRNKQEKPLKGEECPLVCAVAKGSTGELRATIAGAGQQRILVDLYAEPVIDLDGVCHGATLLIRDASGEDSLFRRCQNLHAKATLDALTQLANRAELDRALKAYVKEYLQLAMPFSLVICDIDHFKKINDTCGHQAGDEAIRSVATLLKNSSRGGDLVARYGGEEFVILSPNCTNAAAAARAEQIRASLESIPQPMLEGRRLTASFGVTELQSGDTAETVFRRADRALLKAKEMGRNTVVQLGTGIDGSKDSPGWLGQKWFRRRAPAKVFYKTLVTTVPRKFALEKLWGFVADHEAEIVHGDESSVKLHLSVMSREANGMLLDRKMPIVMELKFSELNEEIQATGDLEHSKKIRTNIQVDISPRKGRDRRRQDLRAHAAQISESLRSYLMAEEVSSSIVEEKPSLPGTGWLRLRKK